MAMKELMMTKDEIAEAIAERIEQQPWVSVECTTGQIKTIVLEVLDEAFG